MDDRATRETYGVARGASGTTTGDGTVLTVTLGYVPKSIVVLNLTDAIRWDKINGMPANTTMKMVTAGTLTADTTSAIQITENGFVCSAALNAAGKSLVWMVN